MKSLRARVASSDESEIDEFLKQKVATKVFLEAANFDVDLAFNNLKACSQWRAENMNNAISLEDVKHEAESCLARWAGFDIRGRPVLTITPRMNYSAERKGVCEVVCNYIASQ